MHTTKVAFLLSAMKPAQFPARDLPEIAFAGRSNVGKSSLINTLLGQRQLARVSATPGRTQSINFFLVNERWLFADLPGYGFAKVPPAVQASWRSLIESYLIDRVPLQGVVLIVDVRREPMDSDLQLKEFLTGHGIPVLLVATKIDKLSRQQTDRQIAAIARAMKVPKDAIVRFSSLNRDGRHELWKEISSLMIEGAERMKALRIAAQEQQEIDPDLGPVVIANEDGSLER